MALVSGRLLLEAVKLGHAADANGITLLRQQVLSALGVKACSLLSPSGHLLEDGAEVSACGLESGDRITAVVLDPMFDLFGSVLLCNRSDVEALGAGVGEVGADEVAADVGEVGVVGEAAGGGAGVLTAAFMALGIGAGMGEGSEEGAGAEEEEAESRVKQLSTMDALHGTSAVLIYFACESSLPSRKFTPTLKVFHKMHAQSKGFEIVFVSDDPDEDTFNRYYSEMPWLAVPYECRDVAAALRRKLQIPAVAPSLVVVGRNGDIATVDGRSKVMENFSTCARFPWAAPTLGESLGANFLCRDGSSVSRESLKGKTVCLYFGSRWCTVCRGFTPIVKEFYERYTRGSDDFEVIFVSHDKDEASMHEHFRTDHGDYLAIPFENRRGRALLSSMFHIRDLPRLVVLSPDGSVLNPSAGAAITAGAAAVRASGWTTPQALPRAETQGACLRSLPPAYADAAFAASSRRRVWQKSATSTSRRWQRRSRGEPRAGDGKAAAVINE